MNIKTTILTVSLLIFLICSAFSASQVAARATQVKRIAHGPTFPPDPEDGVRVAHGPTFPPDPEDGVRVS